MFVDERCGRTGILQVHHPEYVAGRKPWEYALEFCEVLCRGCHAAEHGLVLPREGWMILHSDLDDGEPSDPVPCATVYNTCATPSHTRIRPGAMSRLAGVGGMPFKKHN